MNGMLSRLCLFTGQACYIRNTFEFAGMDSRMLNGSSPKSSG